MKKFFVWIVSMTLFIVLLIFLGSQYRHFYQVGNMTFTIWKKWGGYCYVIPYKYWGMYTPKKNYIRMSNEGNLYIYLDKDSTLLIFNDYLYLNYPDNTVECHLTAYKFRYFGLDSLSSLEDTRLHEIKKLSYKDTLPFIDISPKYMQVEIGK